MKRLQPPRSGGQGVKDAGDFAFVFHACLVPKEEARGTESKAGDANPDSCYVIHDAALETVTFRRVRYDLLKARARFERVRVLPDTSWKRLEKGWR